jgi:hypothetical protein
MIALFIKSQDDDSDLRNQPASSGNITVSGRKVPAIDGKRKRYSGQEGHGIIPATCSRFPPDRTGISAENFGNFPAQNTSSMKSSEFSGTNRFLSVLSGLGYC